MSFIMVDVESDGQIPGDFSMICLGAVVVEPSLSRTFYGRLRPISHKWLPKALQITGFTREQTLEFNDPATVMIQFEEWIAGNSKGRPRFISDNNGFDWQFVNWYFIHFLDRNPFGYSSTNLGSLYKGVVRDMFQSFTHLRKTPHSHHPVDDAKGNAEVLLAIIETYGLKISL